MCELLMCEFLMCGRANTLIAKDVIKSELRVVAVI